MLLRAPDSAAPCCVTDLAALAASSQVIENSALSAVVKPNHQHIALLCRAQRPHHFRQRPGDSLDHRARLSQAIPNGCHERAPTVCRKRSFVAAIVGALRSEGSDAAFCCCCQTTALWSSGKGRKQGEMRGRLVARKVVRTIGDA